MFALFEREVAGKDTMWYQEEEQRLRPRRYPMPVPILCLDEEVRHFAERFRKVFSKPQYQHFVTVYLIGDDSTMHKRKAKKMEGLGRPRKETTVPSTPASRQLFHSLEDKIGFRVSSEEGSGGEAHHVIEHPHMFLAFIEPGNW